jgi:DNA-binding NtrC family response regulator
MSKISEHNLVRIFVVEDDPMYLRLVKYVMELNPDHEVHTFTNGRDCLKNLHLKPQILSLDYSLPDMTGGDLMRQVKKILPEAGFLVLSAQKEVGVAVGLLREGVFDYITKDSETREKLANSVQNLKKQLFLSAEVIELKTQLQSRKQNDPLIVGDSPAMKIVFTALEKAARTNITVSITGATGTGKELAARAIHLDSDRAKGPFVAVNMSAIPKDLLESELFGYEKGAFTGAMNRKKGQFELADKGTLFLDEIGDLDLTMQAKLLRAVQEREFMRVGGDAPIKYDARIVVATHKNLGQEVSEGRFREDLYYRLLGFPIELPPLRERSADILLLANHFLDAFSTQNKLGKQTFSKTAKEKLLQYHFPGNVRELKAVVELAAALANDGTIETEDIRFSAPQKSGNIAWEESGASLEDIKNQVIRTYLDRHQGDVIAVAKQLNVGKSTIYRMIQEEKERKQNKNMCPI